MTFLLKIIIALCCQRIFLPLFIRERKNRQWIYFIIKLRTIVCFFMPNILLLKRILKFSLFCNIYESAFAVLSPLLKLYKRETFKHWNYSFHWIIFLYISSKFPQASKNFMLSKSFLNLARFSVPTLQSTRDSSLSFTDFLHINFKKNYLVKKRQFGRIQLIFRKKSI